MSEFYDVIIVGAGSAGCVLANRLSARSARTVLLIEAGQDLPPGGEPADILDVYPVSAYNPAYKWLWQAHSRTRENSPPIMIEVGRVMGGSGSLMAMIALRGTPDDYDEWVRLGVKGWGWADVLPYFRKLESDSDFQGEMHGDSGPINIRRHKQSEWPPLTRAAQAYAVSRQMPLIEDMNGDFRDGHCVIPISSTVSRRNSSALCYLDLQTRQRKNLHIATSSVVTRLLFEGGRVAGVAVNANGSETVFRANEVILSAGALHSPQLLLRAGIGPAGSLKSVGIDVVADHAGVGRNLQNHPAAYISSYLRRGARQQPALRSHVNTCFRYSSGVPGCSAADMVITIQAKSSWHAIGQRLATCAALLAKPMSRGSIALRSADPAVGPLIESNFLSDERDLARMTDGFRRLVDFVYSKEVEPLRFMPFRVRRVDLLRQINKLSVFNTVKTAVGVGVLDAAPWLVDPVFRWMFGDQVDFRTITRDPAALTEYVKQNTVGQAHFSGTCRMGSAGDPEAVVDAEGRVFQVGGLRVVDASIMPTMPRGNTNIPTLMIAEKIAASMS